MADPPVCWASAFPPHWILFQTSNNILRILGYILILPSSALIEALQFFTIMCNEMNSMHIAMLVPPYPPLTFRLTKCRLRFLPQNVEYLPQQNAIFKIFAEFLPQQFYFALSLSLKSFPIKLQLLFHKRCKQRSGWDDNNNDDLEWLPWSNRLDGSRKWWNDNDQKNGKFCCSTIDCILTNQKNCEVATVAGWHKFHNPASLQNNCTKCLQYYEVPFPAFVRIISKCCKVIALWGRCKIRSKVVNHYKSFLHGFLS